MQYKSTAKKAKKDYVTVIRQHELDADIVIVKARLRAADSFEASIALHNLLTKLEHERRVCDKGEK